MTINPTTTNLSSSIEDENKIKLSSLIKLLLELERS